MAEFHGIEAVTARLKQLLTDHVTDATVTACPLDAKPKLAPPFLNLFLYQVTENPQGNGVPPTGEDDHDAGHPALWLNLHYLLTAAGSSDSDDLTAHRLLGEAMLAFYDNPMIPRHSPYSFGTELIRILPEPIGLDDLSKLWTATTAPYRLSVGYQVSTVLRESAKQRTIVIPIREPPMVGPTK